MSLEEEDDPDDERPRVTYLRSKAKDRVLYYAETLVEPQLVAVLAAIGVSLADDPRLGAIDAPMGTLKVVEEFFRVDELVLMEEPEDYSCSEPNDYDD